MYSSTKTFEIEVKSVKLPLSKINLLISLCPSFSKKNIKNLYRKIPACPKIFQQKIRQKYYCFFSKTHTGDFLRAGMSIA